MIYKCKMCGGELEIQENSSLVECEFCGTTQTIPKVDEEKLLQLYNRATFLLINNEYDKANLIYEKIILDQEEQAEAYWGLCLCKYGIDYVKDPKTNRMIPTCHRTISKSILKDPDYLKTLEFADSVAKDIYESEAKQINKIQKQILDISKNEEPYDIFICYKESDANGKRTIDSVLAEEIYDALTEKEFRVFFSRISLEDKLGQEYEPYIYSALSTAKIMLVVGTKEEYFNAVWVKNEWSRFLKFAETDKKKYLIPCYKDLSPYEMPEEFINLQAQDLSKLGYLQDLVKGIEKLYSKKTKKSASINATVIYSKTQQKIDELMIEAKKLLSEEEFYNAEKKCDEIISLDSKYAYAYLLRYFAFYKVKNFNFNEEYGDSIGYLATKAFLEGLCNSCDYGTDISNAYELGDEKLKEYIDEFREIVKQAKKRREENLVEEEYQKLISMKKIAKSIDDFRVIISRFEKLGDYKDAKKQAEFYKKKFYKEDYLDFLHDALIGSIRHYMSEEEKERVYEALKELGDYQDCKEYVDSYEFSKYRSAGQIESLIFNVKRKKEEIIANNPVISEYKTLTEKNENEYNNLVNNINTEIDNAINTLTVNLKTKQKEFMDVSESLKNCSPFAIKQKKILREQMSNLEIELIKLKRENSNKIDELEANRKLRINELGDQKERLKKQYGKYIADELSNNSEILALDEQIKKLNDDLVKYRNKDSNVKDLWNPSIHYFQCDSVGYYIHYLIIGKYPQDKVTSELLKLELFEQTPVKDNLYLYKGVEFVRVANEFYVVQPMMWRLAEMKSKNGKRYYHLINRYLVELKEFTSYKKIILADDKYINKETGNYMFQYDESDIRKWLNKEFYDFAFSEQEKKFIARALVDNSSATTEDEINEFVCSNTRDKVFLESYRSLKNFVFGEEKGCCANFDLDEKEINKTNKKFEVSVKDSGLDFDKIVFKDNDFLSYTLASVEYVTKKLKEPYNSDLVEPKLRDWFWESEYYFLGGTTDYADSIINGKTLSYFNEDEDFYLYKYPEELGETDELEVCLHTMWTRTPKLDGDFNIVLKSTNNQFNTEYGFSFREDGPSCLGVRPSIIFCESEDEEVDNNLFDF